MNIDWDEDDSWLSESLLELIKLVDGKSFEREVKQLFVRFAYGFISSTDFTQAILDISHNGPDVNLLKIVKKAAERLDQIFWKYGETMLDNEDQLEKVLHRDLLRALNIPTRQGSKKYKTSVGFSPLIGTI